MNNYNYCYQISKSELCFFLCQYIASFSTFNASGQPAIACNNNEEGTKGIFTYSICSFLSKWRCF